MYLSVIFPEVARAVTAAAHFKLLELNVPAPEIFPLPLQVGIVVMVPGKK
jgi:hypothetical protein